MEKHIFLYYMICWGLIFSVSRTKRILTCQRKVSFTLSPYPYIRLIK